MRALALPTTAAADADAVVAAAAASSALPKSVFESVEMSSVQDEMRIRFEVISTARESDSRKGMNQSVL